ncbi:anaphase-promoting complex subunit 1-like isoform X2 [Patiria miniata]|uniref:Anaphase-promoting complex subunit 1 n=1 Tax=Patiria miniata TaxID=46514 RepID=A0A914BEL7_PATMI|nr:anaphase-promoting complex subunit 1-like isoform X2 [Patiria miniata]
MHKSPRESAEVANPCAQKSRRAPQKFNVCQYSAFPFDSFATAALEEHRGTKAMIAASEPHEFIPFGRQFSRGQSDRTGQPASQQGETAGIDLDLPITALREVNISDASQKEFWHISQNRKTDGKDLDYDEEIYIKGTAVVWSRGCQSQARLVQKSYQLDSPIIEAEWVTFRLQDTKGDPLEERTHQTGDAVPSICITQAAVLNVFTEGGDQFTASLPFQVSHSWSMDQGLLLERSVSNQEITSPKRESECLPTLFSLQHPLDEPAPVICKTGGVGSTKIGFMTDYSQQVIFTTSDPSLVVTFDSAMGLHTVWLLRYAAAEEICVASKILDLNTTAANHAQTPRHSYSSGTLAGLSTSAQSRLSLSSLSPSASPYRGLPSRIASPLVFSRPQSPALSVMAALSRTQSPATSALYSPASSMISPARSTWSPGGMSMTSFLNTTCGEVMEPLAPDFCLEHCWTEPVISNREGILGKATRVFLTTDICQQRYLCYLLQHRHQLKCVKFGRSNDQSHLIFGTISILMVKDAVPLQSLDMMVVLDLSNSLVLYTGLVKIGKVHVSGILPSLSSSLPRPSTPLDSPAPLTSSRPSSSAQVIMDEVVMLSPVPGFLGDSGAKLQESACSDEFSFHPGGTSSSGPTRHIIGLRDPVANRFTVELTGETMLRMSIPEVTSSPVVQMCLNALKYVLPRDMAMQLVTRWYNTHNAPGGPGSQSEGLVFAKCLLGMMGYNIEKLAVFQQQDIDSPASPAVATKKHKTSGLDEDWDYLLGSTYHRLACPTLLEPLCGAQPHALSASGDMNQAKIDTGAALFTHIPAVVFALHLIYEELKLTRFHADSAQDLATILYQVASDLKWTAYVDYYYRGHPDLHQVVRQQVSQMSPELYAQMQQPACFTSTPPSMARWLYGSLRGLPQEPYPCIDDICTTSYKIMMLYSLYLSQDISKMWNPKTSFRRLSAAGQPAKLSDARVQLDDFIRSHVDLNSAERTVLFMTTIGFTLRDLEALQLGVALPLCEAIYRCRENPPSSWPEAAYVLMKRQDLSAQARLPRDKKRRHMESSADKESKQEDDGMGHLDQELLRLRFPDDLRVQEVRRLLQSSKPARIALVQKPEVSDHEFIEEQEMRLLVVSQRTMALSIGRGMFTLCTSHPVVTEMLPIPKLNLSGRAPPRNNTISFLHIDVPTNMSSWPSFHNGVAAGLKIAPGCSQIDSTWIVYNRPAGSELTNEHAGFLMALGLNRHLSSLSTLNVHDYLCKGHEMTSVGLLLGLAAAKRGTMDVATTKMLSIHISALLPPTSTELDIPHLVQVAAVMGIGLVYQGTAHRHIAEVLLGEIGRPPGPELENCTDRESYSLAAGLSLGMVMLGHGSNAVGLSDLNMADQLYHYMAGGYKNQPSGANKEKFKSPCYQIKEGDQVNIDVTSPGATLALGLMFFQTANRAVAQWLTAPDTQILLDFVKPDFLLLRTLSKGLVMWNEIEPNSDWIQNNVPEIVKKYAFKRNITAQEDMDIDIDLQKMSQAECNILAGACMAMGLRFAGSANNSAFQCLLHYAQRFSSLASQTISELAGKSTIDTCQNAVLLSVALVMAGTGNLEVLRFARKLHFSLSNDTSYGNHMATHMAIGLLFLGGGRYTLSTAPASIAVLICSLYPQFPVNSNDNRYHLQALRHLYVLAAEPRLILPRDVDIGKPCYAPLEIVYKETPWYEEHTVRMLAPCIIPELKHLKQISVVGPRYLTVTLDTGKNLTAIEAIFRADGTLYVKQRAGHLSYAEDPKGYKSLLAQTFTHDASYQQSMDSEVIRSFTSDLAILGFSRHFCQRVDGGDESSMESLLASLLYECVTKEKPWILQSLIEVHQVINSLVGRPDTHTLWQIKLLLAYYNHAHHRIEVGGCGHTQAKGLLLSAEMGVKMKCRVENYLDAWLTDNQAQLMAYLSQGTLPETNESCRQLAKFLVYHDIPSPLQLSGIPLQVCDSLPRLHAALKDFNLPVSALMKLVTILQTAR